MRGEAKEEAEPELCTKGAGSREEAGLRVGFGQDPTQLQSVESENPEGRPGRAKAQPMRGQNQENAGEVGAEAGGERPASGGHRSGLLEWTSRNNGQNWNKARV